jgi:hypothetical protein
MRVVLLLAVTCLAAGCNKIPRNFPRIAIGSDSTSDSVPVDPPKASRSLARPKIAVANHHPERSAEDENFTKIRKNLKALVAAEEAFYAENGAYSEEFSFIHFKPEDSVEVRFLWITPEGWAASGTHPDLQGRDCVTFVGKAEAPPTTLKYVRSGREGFTVCDDSRSISQPPARKSPLDTSNALATVDPAIAMKVDLRNLVRSQITYFAMQGVYARRTEPLALQYLWHPGVRVKILSADAHSWAAKATHSRFPGGSCVIWVGSVPERPATDKRGVRSTAPGIPVCDQ